MNWQDSESPESTTVVQGQQRRRQQQRCKDGNTRIVTVLADTPDPDHCDRLWTDIRGDINKSFILSEHRHHQQRQQQHIRMIGWYILWGTLHELSHLCAAQYLGYNLFHEMDSTMTTTTKITTPTPQSTSDRSSDTTWSIILFQLIYGMIVGRRCVLPNLPHELDGPVRDIGWIFSCLLAISVWTVSAMRTMSETTSPTTMSTTDDIVDTTRSSSCRKKNNNDTTIIWVTAVITALEALWTDFLQFDQWWWSSSSSLMDGDIVVGVARTTTTTRLVVFCCGNFGIIVLNHWWLQNRATPALDTIDQMVNITMMRGAQSGGVVVYHPTSSTSSSYGPNNNIRRKAIRSRVVNKKRTDLSELLRRRLQRDMPYSKSSMVGCNQQDVGTANGVGTTPTATPANTQTDATMFIGHTRFATSSLSTLEGTHPHRWTHPSFRRVYAMDDDDNLSSTQSKLTPFPNPVLMLVENYITHNGDFDFFHFPSDDTTYDLSAIQDWLSVVTELPTPATVDSCAIAGMVDIIRCQGCWGLSARYALAVGLPHGLAASSLSPSQTRCDNNSSGDKGGGSLFPNYYNFMEGVLGKDVFEPVLNEYCIANMICNLREIGRSPTARAALVQGSQKRLQELGQDKLRPLLAIIDKGGATIGKPKTGVVNPLNRLDNSDNIVVDDDVESNAANGDNGILHTFCKVAVDAFFDNDLFMTTKLFMKYAKGTFGLTVTSTLDAYRQMCMAARGQTMSIAFYPDKDLICFGSEQAAVKAGMTSTFHGTVRESRVESAAFMDSSQLSRHREIDDWSYRLDLDDLGGEILLLDWGRQTYRTSPVSWPNHQLKENMLMYGRVSVILHQESKSTKSDPALFHRMTRLDRNPLVQPLKEISDDPILTDIQDIPFICKSIQDDWNSRQPSSLNRLAAFNLSRCLRKRLEKHVNGTMSTMSVDILLTGCEVSLWVAEQFASDLQKAFPKLRVEAISSNKLLGLYGQEIAVPSLGFPYCPQTRSLNDSIVIIVSHSGGTFGPLACSNLLQSSTQNIFAVTSEMDTQIGKQLRLMDEMAGTHEHLLNQRIFSTDVGIRPAEPCSVSVVATHQLLTNLFQYISAVILSDPQYRRVTRAQITEEDLNILERCNQMNIDALTETVGVNVLGFHLDKMTQVQSTLHQIGDLWADHILENARAYVMCFIYIFVTVTSGFPLVYAITQWAKTPGTAYIARFLDSCIFFFLPQICIILIRIFQRRNLLHRMTGRTVMIGDIPWVAQCADAFLSKCFAVSYSIAGLNVLSGNPVDHFVHRHTHRVVRGTLAIFGRPDGRLSALSTAEASVCLSLNQVCSIQSRGGTCESITIGHNPFKLDLSHAGVFLKRHRPLFLCERLLVEADANHEKALGGTSTTTTAATIPDNEEVDEVGIVQSLRNGVSKMFASSKRHGRNRQRGRLSSMSINAIIDSSVSLKIHKHRSAPALLGAYLKFNERTGGSGNNSHRTTTDNGRESELYVSYTVDDIVAEAIRDKRSVVHIHQLFESIDVNKDGILSKEEFVQGITTLDPSLSDKEATIMYHDADSGHTGNVDYNDFVTFLQNSGYDEHIKVPPAHRDTRGLIQIEASTEKYFGERMSRYNGGKFNTNDMDFALARRQHLVQELYETRIASMQRFVAMCVLFHHMSTRVERFFANLSCGWWAYRMDRTHSIVRIATTASPISGADVRQRIEHLRLWKVVLNSVHLIEVAYLKHLKKKRGMGGLDSTSSRRLVHRKSKGRATESEQ